MSDERIMIESAESGLRLDKVLSARMGGLGRKGARRLFEEGRVRLNGKRANKGDLAQPGDEVVVAMAPEAAHGAVPQEGPLSVRLETDLVVLVDKPAGQPTAPLRPGEVGTLANALLARYPEMASVGHSPREPGLVHRLDNDTSGLVVAARTEASFDALSRGLKAGDIDKRYLLVCKADGLAESGTVEIPLAHHPKDRRRMYACAHPRDVHRYAPRPASTTFRVLEVSGGFALVEARAKSALRHQIRAHLAAIDHALANDSLYGGPPVAEMTGHALHASRVTWRGDATVPAFDVVSPLPEAWAALFGFSLDAASESR